MKDVLKSARIYASLRGSTLEFLAKEHVLRRYAAGDRIIQTGFYSDDIFIIVEGECVVEVAMEGAARKEVAVVLPGESIGEFCLIEKAHQRTAFVTERTPVTVARIRGTSLEQVRTKEPSIGYQIFKNISTLLMERIVKSNERLAVKQNASA